MLGGFLLDREYILEVVVKEAVRLFHPSVRLDGQPWRMGPDADGVGFICQHLALVDLELPLIEELVHI